MIATSAFAVEVDGEIRLGSTFLFDLDGELVRTIENPHPDENSSFGGRVVVLGDDRLAISAYRDNTAGELSGSVFVFDLSGNLEHIIPNPSPARLDWFGRTMIGLSADRLAVGSIFDDTLGENAGAVYIFGATGELLQTILPPEPVEDGHFGQNLGTYNDRLVIGSNFAGGGFTGPGAVYLYSPVELLSSDYNGDGIVDQADLDLVLLNWGADGSTPPAGWTGNLPDSVIDQDELDGVLLNWGATQEISAPATSIPEPGSTLLSIMALSILVFSRIRLRDQASK